MSQPIPQRFAGAAVDLSHLAARGAGAQPGMANTPAAAPASGVPGAGQVVDVPSLVLDVDEQTFPQVAQLSQVVPVVVELWTAQHPHAEALAATLTTAAKELGGKVLVARVNADASPRVADAFGAQQVPAVFALVNGSPVPLFQGVAELEQVRQLFAQLLQLAQQQGISGRVNAPDLDDAATEPTEVPVNPAHAEALEALEQGEYAAAVAAYEQVLLKAPADTEAKAALVQVKLLDRLSGLTVDEIRSAAAADPHNVDAQLRVADLDVSGGHVEDAFLRLLEFFANNFDADDRNKIRERLLELFEVVGVADPRVGAARTKLANMLY